ncbi:MAG: sugar ABC transporter permease [Lachnospiraceae bacterium]|jgi:multiple sugar transport system permease protein|nr:sugar ABC transporter permease [Lachnospiraceae bacterium]
MKKAVWNKINKHHTSYLMVAPFMILFIVLTVIPVFIAIFYSFSSYNVMQQPQFFAFRNLFDNYLRLFLDDEVFLIALRNTFVFAFITGPISYVACLLIAWFINDLGPKLRAWATLLFYAPSLSANVYFIWQYIFSSDANGLLNTFLMNFGFISEPVLWRHDPRYTLMVVIIVQLWLSLGTAFLAFIAGLQGVDRQLYEAGAIDGVKNRWQELYFITLPSMKEQLMFGAVIQIAAAFSVGLLSAELIGRPSPLYSAHTLVMHMEDYALAPRFELGYACAIATVLFSITLGINQLVRSLLRRSSRG